MVNAAFSEEKNLFQKKSELKLKEETITVLHLKHSFVWCWMLDTLESRSEIPGKFWKMVVMKDGQDQWINVWKMKKHYIEWRKELFNIQ